MDRRACWAAVHGVTKEWGMTTTYRTLVLRMLKVQRARHSGATEHSADML